MGLSDLINSMRDRQKPENDSASMKMSKQFENYSKESGKSFNKLINIQEKSPTQKKQTNLQQDIKNKTIVTNNKLDSLSKYTQHQTKLMNESNKINAESSKHLHDIKKSHEKDRQERKQLRDEERRYRRQSLSNMQTDIRGTKNRDKSPLKEFFTPKNVTKTLGTMVLTSVIEGIAFRIGTMLVKSLIRGTLGAGIVRGVTGLIRNSVVGVFNLGRNMFANLFSSIGTGVNALRSFFFGAKVVNAEGTIIKTTQGVFGKLASAGTFLFNVFDRGAKSVGGFTNNILKILKVPQTLTALKNIPFIAQGLNAVKNSSLVTKGVNAGRAVAGAASNLGGRALNLGKSALNFLAPTVNSSSALGKVLTGGSVFSKAGAGLLGRVLPGVGAVLSAGIAINDFQKGDYLGTLINTVAAITNLIPGFGPLISGMLTVVDLVRKGEVTKIFSTVSDGIKSAVNYVGDMFNPDKFIDGIKKWWGGTWLGRKLMGTQDPSTLPNSSNTPSKPPTLLQKVSNIYNYMTGNSSTSTTTASGVPINNSSLAESTFKALYLNEASESQKAKISHAIKENSNFTFGRSQFDIGQRADAWKRVGFSDDEITKLKGIGDKARALKSVKNLSREDKDFIAQMQIKLQDKKDVIDQLDIEQQQNLSNKAKNFVQHLGSLGFTFSSPSVIAQFADIFNQFGSMDYKLAPELLQKFSGGKIITPEAILKYRLYRSNSDDQKRRYANVESQFKGMDNQNINAGKLISDFNTDKPVNNTTPTSVTPSPPSLLALPSSNDFSSKQNDSVNINAKPIKESSNNKNNGEVTGKPGNPLGTINPHSKVSSPPNPDRNGRPHKGTDFAVPVGTPIYAAYAGNVSYAGWASGYGLVIYIAHKGGYETRYAHLSKINVFNGQFVSPGQLIGYSGNTGVGTGPHLHYELRKGEMFYDPFGLTNKVADLGTNMPTDNPIPHQNSNNSQTSSSGSSMSVPFINNNSSTQQTNSVAAQSRFSTEIPILNVPESMQNMDYKSAKMSDTEASVNKQLNKAIFGTPVSNNLLPNIKESDIMKKSNDIKHQVSNTQKEKDLLLKKTTDNLKKSVKDVKQEESKFESKIRVSLISAIRSSYPKATTEQVNIVLDKLKSKISCKTDTELLAFLDRFDSVMMKDMLEGYGLTAFLKETNVTSSIKKDDSITSSVPLKMESPDVTKASEGLKDIVKQIDTNKYAPQHSSPSTQQESTGSGIFKGIGKMALTALGVPEASALLDFLPNPVDMIENIWNVGSSLLTGDSNKIQSALMNKRKSGVDNLVEGVMRGDKGVVDVVKTAGTLASGFGVDTGGLTSALSSVGIDLSKVDLSRIGSDSDLVKATLNSVGLDSNTIGTGVTDSFSKSTGVNITGLLNTLGINPGVVVDKALSGDSVQNIATSSFNQAVNSGVSLDAMKDSLLIKNESTVVDTKALDLTKQEAIQHSITQEQIKNSLNNIDAASQKTTSSVSTMATNQNTAKQKANLLNYADVGTAQIQSNIWG